MLQATNVIYASAVKLRKAFDAYCLQYQVADIIIFFITYLSLNSFFFLFYRELIHNLLIAGKYRNIRPNTVTGSLWLKVILFLTVSDRFYAYSIQTYLIFILFDSLFILTYLMWNK